MATALALDASPAKVLRSMRGSIVAASLAHPDVLHVEIRDARGDIWRLATQDADWSPSDPDQLVGHSIEDAEIDEQTGELRCKLSDGVVLDLKPGAREANDDPPNWELITPGGVVLEFGPGLRWQISGADAPRASSAPLRRPPARRRASTISPSCVARCVVGVDQGGRDFAVAHPLLEGAQRHAGRGHRVPNVWRRSWKRTRHAGAAAGPRSAWHLADRAGRRSRGGRRRGRRRPGTQSAKWARARPRPVGQRHARRRAGSSACRTRRACSSAAPDLAAIQSTSRQRSAISSP